MDITSSRGSLFVVINLLRFFQRFLLSTRSYCVFTFYLRHEVINWDVYKFTNACTLAGRHRLLSN